MTRIDRGGSPSTTLESSPTPSPPAVQLDPDLIWNAFIAIEAPNVRHSPAHALTDLVPLVGCTVGGDHELIPYAEFVRDRYAAWLAQQAQADVRFTHTERWWLDRMVSVIAFFAGNHLRKKATNGWYFWSLSDVRRLRCVRGEFFSATTTDDGLLELLHE